MTQSTAQGVVVNLDLEAAIKREDMWLYGYAHGRVASAPQQKYILHSSGITLRWQCEESKLVAEDKSGQIISDDVCPLSKCAHRSGDCQLQKENYFRNYRLDFNPTASKPKRPEAEFTQEDSVKVMNVLRSNFSNIEGKNLSYMGIVDYITRKDYGITQDGYTVWVNTSNKNNLRCRKDGVGFSTFLCFDFLICGKSATRSKENGIYVCENCYKGDIMPQAVVCRKKATVDRVRRLNAIRMLSHCTFPTEMPALDKQCYWDLLLSNLERSSDGNKASYFRYCGGGKQNSLWLDSHKRLKSSYGSRENNSNSSYLCERPMCLITVKATENDQGGVNLGRKLYCHFHSRQKQQEQQQHGQRQHQQ